MGCFFSKFFGGKGKQKKRENEAVEIHQEEEIKVEVQVETPKVESFQLVNNEIEIEAETPKVLPLVLVSKKHIEPKKTRKDKEKQLELQIVYQLKEFDQSIIATILGFVHNNQLLKCRILNSLWKSEVDRIAQEMISKKLIEFKSVVDAKDFLQFGKVQLCSSFKWNLYYYGDLYDLFIRKIGKAAKCLDLSNRFISTEGFSIDQVRFEMLQLERPEPIFSKFYQKIIFEDFPNLVKLSITDSYYPDGTQVFDDEETREKLYGKAKLTSLKWLSISMFAETSQNDWQVSDRILLAAPNLEDVEVKIKGEENFSTDTFRIMSRALRAISKYASQVEGFYVFSSFPTKLPLEHWNVRGKENFQALKLKRLEFHDKIFMADLRNYWKFFRDVTPIFQTIEELHFTSFNPERRLCSLFVEQNLNFPFSGFEKLRVLHVEYRVDDNALIELQEINSQFPYLEKLTFTHLSLPGSLKLYRPWSLLRKLTLFKFLVEWETIGEFNSFFKSLRTFAPNLWQFAIEFSNVPTFLHQSDLLLYPFITWMRNKWKLRKFTVVDPRELYFHWDLSVKDNLGISSFEDLSDEEGNFTTKKIKRHYLLEAFQYTFNDYCMKEKNKEFVLWILNTFPNIELEFLKELPGGMGSPKTEFLVLYE